MVKKIGIVLTSLVLALVMVIPAHAAAGDVKFTVFDVTTGTTVVVCTPATTPCTPTFTAGHTYSFTVQEASNAASKMMYVNLQASGWSSPNWAYGYTGTPNPCTVANTATSLGVSCVATTNRVNYVSVQAVASSSSDLSALGKVTKDPAPQTFAVVDFNTP